MIGIDEAGYGPNLGPLVVGATAWQVALAPSAQTNAPPVDLYSRLTKIVATQPTDDRIAIADSKLLYKPRGSLRLLERGVFVGLRAQGNHSKGTPNCWQSFWDATLADPAGLRHRLPWYADYDCLLPIDAEIEELSGLQNKFQSVCREANIGIVDLRARAVFPREFNDLTNHYGTKGAALSHISIGLLRDVLDQLFGAIVGDSKLPSTQMDCVDVTFDKHGGRNRYAELLRQHFPDQAIETLLESRPASRYQWGPPERRVHICFRTKGESELPTALASMVAKYHRELAMRALNAFWKEKVPGLRPTAGYPLDAKRFKADIATKQLALGIDDHDLWRNR